jgi:hypothetical protein
MTELIYFYNGTPENLALWVDGVPASRRIPHSTWFKYMKLELEE